MTIRIETTAEEVARLRADERKTWVAAGSSARVLANFDKRTARLIASAEMGDALEGRRKYREENPDSEADAAQRANREGREV
jgi:hypothetical protein